MTEIALSTSEFTVDIDPSYMRELLKKAFLKFKNKHELSKHLINKYRLKYTARNLADFIQKIYKGKKRMRLSYLLAFAELAGENVQSEIKGIRALTCRNSLKTKYPIFLDPSWAFVSECIKVEGHLRKRNATLENTNTELISEFKKHLNYIGTPNTDIVERLHIRIQVPENTRKENIKIIKEDGTEVKNFHMRVLKLKKGDKNEVVFSDSFEYGTKNKYAILADHKTINCEIYIPPYEKIIGESDYNTEYQAVTASVLLIINSVTLSKILNQVFEIPFGNKSAIIKIPELIKNADINIIKSAINAVLASESTVSVSDRFIAIASISKTYLKDFQEILQKFKINSSIGKKTICIYGLNNFKRINKNFDFIILNKREAIKKTLLCNEQTPKNKAEIYYLKNLSELGGHATWNKLMEFSKRRGSSLRIYRDRLLEKGYIESDSKWPATYNLTEDGRNILINSDISYWGE